jgi:pectate lyase
MIKVRGAFLTLDGFTAADPITLMNYGIGIDGDQGAHDVIVRGIRVRNAALDGITIRDCAYNIVVDHVSIHGSGDGNIDITQSAHDVTVSWSILAEPYDPVKRAEKNMLIKYNPSRVTLHHNIFIKASQRNPQVRIDDAGTPANDTTVDMRNNLVWDWEDGYGTLIWYGPWANVVNNFYSSPSSSSSARKRALTVSKGARAYVSGNLSADNVDVNAVGNEQHPFPAPPVDTEDACTAAHEVLSGAGVRPLDLVDQQYLALISLLACPGS